MNTDETKQFIRDYLEAFAQGNRQEAIERYVADPNLKEHIVMFDEGLPGYQLIEEDLIVEGDKAVLRCQVVGTHAGDLMGIPATGRNVKVPAIVIYQIADRKVVGFWVQSDVLSLLEQIGAVPSVVPSQ